ncbi:MAG TPA: sulfite exporter TauE/SafE family protein [Candidatus Acidoferrum sp.]|nr:sulfite exporter TauE/SafE family protein [Candidatus Acidoferrum sp.]
MLPVLAYVFCGLLTGIMGGYLGLGGGIIMVPYLTLLMGLDIKMAVPISMAAIVVNSLASSSEYLKKDMVDLRLVIILGTAMVLGTAIGSSSLAFVPSNYVRLIFCAVLIYTAILFLRGKGPKSGEAAGAGNGRQLALVFTLTLLGGILAGLVGVGGGVIVIPLMFFVLGLPLSTARGTSSFIVGFAGATSVAVYLVNGLVDLSVVSPVMLGTILGGRLGGSIGTLAKPTAVRIVFFILLMYVAVKLGYGALKEIL